MNGIVWGSTFERAVKKLEEIEENYLKNTNEKILSRRKGSHSYEFVMTNGDYWKAVSAHESMRGCKSNISYIDNEIDFDFISSVIKYCTKAYPYQAFKYF